MMNSRKEASAFARVMAWMLALTLMLLGNPFNLYDVGFILSFAASAGILLLTEPLEALFGVCPAVGLQLWANFYVCGDRTPCPCYGAWNDVQTTTPDFHRPEFFGRLILA